MRVTKWVPPLAQGTPRDNTDVVRCTASFDTETFAQIQALAIKQKSSVAAAIRLLVEWGLEVAR